MEANWHTFYTSARNGSDELHTWANYVLRVLVFKWNRRLVRSKDVVVKRKFPAGYLTPVIQPVASHLTELLWLIQNNYMVISIIYNFFIQRHCLREQRIDGSRLLRWIFTICFEPGTVQSYMQCLVFISMG